MERRAALVLLMLFAPAVLGAQPKNAPRFPKPKPSPTAPALTADEKAALRAIRAYHSVRETSDREATQRYFLDAKVKVDLLPDSALASKLREAFAPTVQARDERELIRLMERAASLTGEPDAEKAVVTASERVEANRIHFAEFGTTFDSLHSKYAAALSTDPGPRTTATLLNMLSWQALETVGKERSIALTPPTASKE